MSINKGYSLIAYKFRALLLKKQRDSTSLKKWDYSDGLQICLILRVSKPYIHYICINHFSVLLISNQGSIDPLDQLATSWFLSERTKDRITLSHVSKKKIQESFRNIWPAGQKGVWHFVLCYPIVWICLSCFYWFYINRFLNWEYRSYLFQWSLLSFN